MRTETQADTYISQIPKFAKEKASLDEVKVFLEQMGNPQRQTQVIHIAGTNGKGSVSAFLTQILTDLGYVTARFTSPHLVKISERFFLGGEREGKTFVMTEELYVSAFEAVLELTDRMQRQGYRHPTFFEFLFYMQMELVKRVQPDFLVLETGMGGRRDVTNAIEQPVLTILTSIGMDHMQYLGNSLEAIAGEKAGILKKGVPLVFAAHPKQVNTVIRARAESLGCPFFAVKESDWQVERLCCESDSLSLRLFGNFCQLSTVAMYQAENAALAFQAARQLFQGRREFGSLDTRILSSLERTRWEGRMEQVLPHVYLDGAHNEDGILALTRTLHRMYEETERRMVLLFAAASDKEHEKMVKELCQALPLAAVLVVRYDSERALSTEELRREFSRYSDCLFESYFDLREAFLRGLSLRQDGILVAAGSLYLVGELKALIASKRVWG
ncbi:MAG: Mur ligase family protein [bacterium]|nr:Mur ligase family protein [bacterium]